MFFFVILLVSVKAGSQSISSGRENSQVAMSGSSEYSKPDTILTRIDTIIHLQVLMQSTLRNEMNIAETLQRD